MKTVIVYDSFFGNTEKTALAIRDGMAGVADVRVVKAGGDVRVSLEDCDLIIVGSPTRGFRHSPRIQTFLDELPRTSLSGKRVAAFDTRMVIAEVNNRFLTFLAGIFGYAAEKIGGGLKKKGGSLAAPPEGFFVAGSEGPLKPGELERAAAWGKSLIR